MQNAFYAYAYTGWKLSLLSNDSGDERNVLFASVILFHLCCVGPCHHSMARPRYADGGDGLRIWRVL
jgi:hypothetical protein